jgi:hypothetical protein
VGSLTCTVVVVLTVPEKICLKLCPAELDCYHNNRSPDSNCHGGANGRPACGAEEAGLD